MTLISSRRTNRTQGVRVYSHDGPIGCRACGCLLTTDQSDAGRAGVFSTSAVEGRRARRRVGE
eukprot:1195673-Prorocentrum_minimum.AAC.4